MTQTDNGTGSGKPAEGQTGESKDAGKTIEFTRQTVNSTEKAVVTAYDKTKTFLEHADPRRGLRIIERILDWDRRILPKETLEKIVDWFAKAGVLGLVGAQILAFVFFIIAAIKFSDWNYFFYAFGAVIALAIFQFTADRFISADRSMVEHSPSRLGSAAFLDCVAVLAEIGGLAAFAYYAYMAKQGSEWGLLWHGLAFWVVADMLAHLALNPSMLNLSITDDARAGDEALSILSFFAKAAVRIVPIAFGVGIIVGDLFLAWAFVDLFRYEMVTQGFAAFQGICLCAALPFAGYIAFAFYHLALDLMWAILAVPRKLDELKDNRRN